MYISVQECARLHVDPEADVRPLLYYILLDQVFCCTWTFGKAGCQASQQDLPVSAHPDLGLQMQAAVPNYICVLDMGAGNLSPLACIANISLLSHLPCSSFSVLR